jgi:hypothetical protein
MQLSSNYINSIAKRLHQVENAIKYKTGTFDDPVYTELWSKGKYSVGVNKPGKEQRRKGDKENKNDMKPVIKKSGVILNVDPTFRGIFQELEDLGSRNPEALRKIGILIFRNAYMEDHNDLFQYNLPAKYLRDLNVKVGLIYGVTVDVLLHYIEAIALNEDVKYHTLGRKLNRGVGRQNMLLTFVNFIAVLLKGEKISHMIGEMTKQPICIAPIELSIAKKLFPELGLK